MSPLSKWSNMETMSAFHLLYHTDSCGVYQAHGLEFIGYPDCSPARRPPSPRQSKSPITASESRQPFVCSRQTTDVVTAVTYPATWPVLSFCTASFHWLSATTVASRWSLPRWKTLATHIHNIVP